MLISKLTDEKCEEKLLNESAVEDDSHEYQTANELFELMTKNQNFNLDDENALTPGELVLLYENIDRGTKLMSDAKDIIRASTNQRVETVVYEGIESDSSELSDVLSDEDLHSVVLLNKEQMDFLNVQPSVEHTLCHKFGDFELETTFNNDYEKHFIFQDPFIKEQLKGCNLISLNKDINCSSFLPPSLLDYICCRRLEDNYNFYMENIIRYVKNTIDQLKRISNGDYLTANAKKKWKEVENVNDADHNNTKVLATSTKMPLHVECKVDGFRPTWDDIVHSAVDIKSLSKILEKKLIVEIPKFIKGSYTLLSRYYNDKLIISCKKDQSRDDSRVDVVLKLKRSPTGHVISKISSIMVLQNTPTTHGSKTSKTPLPILYKPLKKVTHDQNEGPKDKQLNNSSKKQENAIKDNKLKSFCKEQDHDKVIELESPTKKKDKYVKINKIEAGESAWTDCCFEVYPNSPPAGGYQKAGILQPRRRQNRKASLFTINQDKMTESKTNIAIGGHLEELEVCQAPKDTFNIPPDDLKISIKSLGIQSALPEESTEDVQQSNGSKSSPTRVRIKSPYENQSYVIEEKKRKKLLEIREKREKRKKAQLENCKFTKTKFDNAGPMPQASTSVTKLSITNKSFYNSIYGDSTSVETKPTKNKTRKRDTSKEVSDRNLESGESKTEICEPRPENETRKFINRSYYLDDTVTEMMYMNMKQQEKEKENSSPSTSAISCDFRTNLNIISQLIIPYSSSGNITDELDAQAGFSEHTSKIFIDSSDIDSNGQSYIKNNLATPLNVPSNTPKGLKNGNNTDLQVECRKSIDKIYQLMNKRDRDKAQYSILTIDMGEVEGSIHESESGTSLKHQISSSHSTFSFDKQNNEVPLDNTRTPRNVVPKVIISTRSQFQQSTKNNDNDQNRKDRRLLNNNNKIRDKNNPLKAISQLLHEFENVQRNRTKPRSEQKCLKTTEAPVAQDIKQNPLLWSQRRKSRLEQHNEALEVPAKGPPAKTAMTLDNVKVPFQQIPYDAKANQKICVKKKINEIFDEAKEARGEAVKGPPRFNARLNSLAQPKKSYVQAHSEEYQTRYGRNLITDRLQRLASANPSPPVLDKPPRLISSANRYNNNNNNNNKGKRIGNQAVSPIALKNQTGLSIEKGNKTRYPNNSSPDQNKQALLVVGQSYKHTNVPEPPQIIKKDRKMVAVESYVKSHYGRSPPIADKPQKARAPVLPSCIDTGSSSNTYMHQESTEVGSKLHDIIETMLNCSTKNLESVSECFEVNSKSSRDNNPDSIMDDFSLNALSSHCEEIVSMESNDVCKTKHRNTMMNTAGDFTKHKDEQRYSAGENMSFKNYDKQPSKSATTIDKTEDLLPTTRLSLVALSEHRKIKNNNLSPKSSIQKLLFLQSGDAGSQMVHLDLSKKLISEKFSNLKPIRSLSKPSWDFPVITEPITLAYLLPKYDKETFEEVVSPSLTHIFQQVSKEGSLQCAPICQNTVDISVIDNESLLSLENCATDNKQCDNNEQLQSVLCKQLATQIESLNPIVSYKNLKYLSFNASNDNSCPGNGPLLTKENKATVNKEVIEKKVIQTQTSSVKEKNENCDTSKNSETADYTASLDILIGLLNEIQKITTCQNSYIAKNKTEGTKELEMILNNSPGMVNSIRSTYNFSISSLDKLRCLESDQSVYSIYISERDLMYDGPDNCNIKPALESRCTARNLLYKPICVDKEVAVNISNKEYKDKLINVPSIFPLTISQSTHMSNVVLEKLCQSAKQSVLPVTDYHSKYSHATTVNSIYPGAYSNKITEVLPQRNVQGPSVKNHPDLKKGGDKKTLKQKVRSIKAYAIVKNKESTKNADHDLCVENVKFDPVMKLKRDVLVTVYSMLVLTVFAALSFPEMLYYVV